MGQPLEVLTSTWDSMGQMNSYPPPSGLSDPDFGPLWASLGCSEVVQGLLG